MHFASVLLVQHFADHTATPKGMAQDPAAMQTFLAQRAQLQQVGHQEVQEVYWSSRKAAKRGPPTPAPSGPSTPAEPAAPTTTLAEAPPTLVHPFTLDNTAADAVTAAEMGVNINDRAALQAWQTAPVTTTQDVMKILKSYHKTVIRPELYNMVLQLENALRNVDDRLFQAKRELEWMAKDNRNQQRIACGLQVLLSGFPTGIAPNQRGYMTGWMLKQVDGIRTFCKDRGYVTAETEEELGRYFNALTADPVTIPQGDSWSPMTMIMFKAWAERQSFMERYTGQGGTPFYMNETTPHQNVHIKVSPCSPQWQRKLESPLRVVLSCINNHPDFTSAPVNIFVLWKTLTIMQPCARREFQEDAIAWARLFYSGESGEFRGRLELHPDLMKICVGPPANVGAEEPNLWGEQWNLTQWGPQRELDLAEEATYEQAKKESLGSGKGIAKGKPRRHWSTPFTYTSYANPFPYELDVLSVERIAFCWDEYCIKSGSPKSCVGDMKVSAYGGKPDSPDHNAQGYADDEQQDATMGGEATHSGDQRPVMPSQKWAGPHRRPQQQAKVVASLGSPSQAPDGFFVVLNFL